MQLKDYFPIWNQLTEAQQKQITQRAVLRKAEKGTISAARTISTLRVDDILRGAQDDIRRGAADLELQADG
jgi:hypothetical protein